MGLKIIQLHRVSTIYKYYSVFFPSKQPHGCSSAFKDGSKILAYLSRRFKGEPTELAGLVRHHRLHSLNVFSKSIGLIEAKFHMESLQDEGTKFYIFSPGHMTKMGTMPIYGKNLKKISLQDHCVSCL